MPGSTASVEPVVAKTRIDRVRNLPILNPMFGTAKYFWMLVAKATKEVNQDPPKNQKQRIIVFSLFLFHCLHYVFPFSSLFFSR